MIRQMEPRDKAPVVELIRATGFFTPDEIAVAEELMDAYLEEPEQEDYHVVVVENDQKAVAGYMTWGPTPLAEGAYDLYWMAVSPAEQGKGWGKALVRWLEDEVRRRDGRMILIETSSQPKYHGTRQFYIGLEYQEVARVPDFYRVGDDRIIYAKYFR
jgi:ribosomal protein S18 acetylase RimI-like enzyme